MTVSPAGPLDEHASKTVLRHHGIPIVDEELVTTPDEADMEWAIAKAKPFFVGKRSIEIQRAAGVKRKLVGFKMTGKGIARHGYPVVANGKEIGVVTSGTMSPTLKTFIGLAYVPAELAANGTAINIKIRDKEVAAEVIPTPFYKRKK